MTSKYLNQLSGMIRELTRAEQSIAQAWLVLANAKDFPAQREAISEMMAINDAIAEMRRHVELELQWRAINEEVAGTQEPAKENYICKPEKYSSMQKILRFFGAA